MSENKPDPDFILVAIDGSRPSQVAATFAIQIAQRENLLVHGLYVVEELLVVDATTNLEKELGYQLNESLISGERARLLEEQGDAILRWLEEQGRAAGVPVNVELMFGGLPDLIHTKANDAQILALGRRGHSHTGKSTALGDYFRAIAHHTDRPLLAGGDVFHPIRKIVLAYNGSPAARRALTWTCLLQDSLQSQVVVLSIAENHASDQWLSKMKTQIDGSDLTDWRFVGSKGEPAAQIVATAAEEHADLIVMGSYRHGPLLEWLTGSTLDQVLRHTPLPVFIAGKQ